MLKTIDLFEEKYIPMWEFYKNMYNITTTDFVTGCVISGMAPDDALELLYCLYRKKTEKDFYT